MHPSGAMEIRFDKPSFRYVAGQWLFLAVPDVSSFQWHPFTISSAPDDPYISVHVRQVGDFTRALGDRLGCTAALAEQLSARASSGGTGEKGGEGEFVEFGRALMAAGKMPVLRIDGPYGAPAEDVFRNEGELHPLPLVLIGWMADRRCGSRGTRGHGNRSHSLCIHSQEHMVRPSPPFSVLLSNTDNRMVMHCRYMQKQNKLGALRRVEFIWINRDTGSFEWFQALLKQLEDVSLLTILYPHPCPRLQSCPIHFIWCSRPKRIPISYASTPISRPKFHPT